MFSKESRLASAHAPNPLRGLLVTKAITRSLLSGESYCVVT
jgi:hypothetical protein